MSDFRFANPDASFVFWLILLAIAMLVWFERRRSDALSRLLSPTMQKLLVARPSAIRRWSVIGLTGLSAICFVLALMRPQYGLTYVKSPRVGAQIMFCLDVSKSMLAEDTAPNRLERAKADIVDMLSFLEGDQVGLIGFAGRASVLCPLTPDYGFFKLILESAGPSSVGRGGTRLEEPLRKALDGFRTESDVSRVVFLITDGEDHDSHPLDVAKDAIERGVKVVAVGLGDEGGSEIRITDPNTGVQTVVRDADGNPVVSRLDGETLRKLTLATEGVYIPAGTGSLDLKSIYDAHIQPLVRGEMQTKGRAIRKEAFQWAVLAGLALVMLAIFIGSGRAVIPVDATAMTMIAVAVSMGTAPAFAVETPESETATEQASNLEEQQPDPRALYNQGLAEMTGRIAPDLDKAEALLTDARQSSGTDGEVRYRATYNLGWVSVGRADKLIESEPEKALAQLQNAAGWFRDTIRLRPDADDARHNLEVVLQRILQLRDQLAQKEKQDLAAKLDALIDAERKETAQLRSIVELVSSSEDANVVDQYRSEFERLAVQQRLIASDLQGVSEEAFAELQTLQDVDEEELTVEQRIRAASLTAAAGFLNQASQRVSQARSQLRRRQATRGFRRASAGLSQLKRARDQLRGPLELLDGLLTDTTTTMQHTALKSLEKQVIADADDQALQVPAWIDQQYLAESQDDLSQRMLSLTRRMESGLQQQPSTEDEQSAADTTPEQKAFLEQLRSAMPHLTNANTALKQAAEKIGLSEFAPATDQQLKAIESLQEAREQFADLRRLIEIIYATQTEIDQMIQQFATPETEESLDGDAEEPERPEGWEEQATAFAQDRLSKNTARMSRLEQLIASEKAKAIEADAAAQVQQNANAPDADSATPSLEIQRFEFASKLAATAIEQLKTLESELRRQDASEKDATTEQMVSSSTAAVETIQELRRLFFSVLEHLKETAGRQSKLNDQTEQQAALQAESKEPESTDRKSTENGEDDESSKLAFNQQELMSIAQQIAQALTQQAESASQSGEQAASQGNAGQQAQDTAEKTGKAAELVEEATQEMQTAIEKLQLEQHVISDAREPQDKALLKLVEAIQTLEPPQQDQPQDQQNQDQSSDQNDSQEQQQDPSQQQNQDQSPQQNQPETAEEDAKMDPSRVLQGVRDREAERRRDKEKRQAAGQVTVEKDW